MKPAPPKTAENAAAANKAYEQLPVKTKEMLKLQDQIENSTGPEKAALHKKARGKSNEAAPPKDPQGKLRGI